MPSWLIIDNLPVGKLSEGGRMAELYDAMRRLAVAGRSPDKSVTIVAAGTPARIRVAIASGSTEQHTEESLERQINGAIRIAMTAYQQGATRAWERAARIGEDG